MAGWQVLLSTNSHWPVAGLQESSVQTLLSSQVLGAENSHAPVVVSQESVVQALLSLQTFGVFEQAPEPERAGSQTSIVQRLLSLQKTTGVLFGVVAATPAVFSGESCATPPV